LLKIKGAMKLRVLPALGGSLIVGLAVAGCGPAQGTPPAAAAGTTAAAGSAAATTSAPAATSPSAAVASGSPSASAAASASGVQNLIADASVKQQLITAIAQLHDYSVSNIASTAPGTVYYAYDPANGSYYAEASVVLAADASSLAQISNQDDGGDNFFRRVGDGPWQVEEGGGFVGPNICTAVKFFPAPVLAVWNQTPTPADLAADNCG